MAARAALEGMQSDHAAAPLLRALAQRLCRDVDEAERVAERIAATRMVLELLKQLDGALFVSGAPPTAGPDDGEVPDPEAVKPDDPFEIGDVPPGMGDPAP